MSTHKQFLGPGMTLLSQNIGTDHYLQSILSSWNNSNIIPIFSYFLQGVETHEANYGYGCLL